MEPINISYLRLRQRPKDYCVWVSRPAFQAWDNGSETFRGLRDPRSLLFFYGFVP